MMRTSAGVSRSSMARGTRPLFSFWALVAAVGWTAIAGVHEAVAQNAPQAAPEERTSRLDRVFQGIRYRPLDEGTAARVTAEVALPEGEWASPHQPSVRYRVTGAVERSSDSGESWTSLGFEVSADPGDVAPAPAEGEVPVVPTWVVAESPVEPGLLWVGGGAGRIFLTRDGGATWSAIDVPAQASGARIRTIEPSYLDGGKAYVVMDRLAQSDSAPFVFRAEAYGGDWVALTGQYSGIPDDHTVTVVRSDPLKEGLLFAGTVRGVFVSFDDGGSWDLFQFGLPDEPVTALSIIDRDLVVGTARSGTWVLDDLSPLREVMAGLATGEPYLFEPSPTYLDPSEAGPGATPSQLRAEAIFDYLLPSNVRNVRLEVFDGAGSLVTDFRAVPAPNPGASSGSGSGAAPGAGAGVAQGAAAPAAGGVEGAAPVRQVPGNRAGVHRIVWDLTAGRADAPARGDRVMAGTYRLRMTVDGLVRERDFEVVGGSAGR